MHAIEEEKMNLAVVISLKQSMYHEMLWNLADEPSLLNEQLDINAVTL